MKRATGNVDARSAVNVEMALPRIAASVQAATHADAELKKRRLAVVKEHSFHGYACSWCGRKFPMDDGPYVSSLASLHRARMQREKDFLDHVCPR